MSRRATCGTSKDLPAQTARHAAWGRERGRGKGRRGEEEDGEQPARAGRTRPAPPMLAPPRELLFREDHQAVVRRIIRPGRGLRAGAVHAVKDEHAPAEPLRVEVP